jgi:hypothetical protein
VRPTRWPGRVPVAAWAFLAIAAAQLAISGRQDAASSGGVVPFLSLAFAVGVFMANRTLWAAAFVVTGVGLTLLGIQVAAATFGLSPSVAPPGVFALEGLEFAALVALHPRWNPHWAD